jgi:hypothetical protein
MSIGVNLVTYAFRLSDLVTVRVDDTNGHVAAEPAAFNPTDAPRTHEHLHHPSVVPRVQAVTNHAAAYIQRWYCELGSPGQHLYVTANRSYVPMEARISAGMLIAAGRGPARVPTCEQTLRQVRTKFYYLVPANDDGWFMADKLRHELGFEEWQDDHDDRTRRLRGMGFRTARVDDFSPVLARALSLFGPGELRALRVLDVDVFRLLTSLMRSASAGGGGPAPDIGRAMDSLCAFHVAPYFSTSADTGSLAALLERHSSTITELHAEIPTGMIKEVSSALARCTRLESLTDASRYDPAVWLGLSQLHTLCGVDLGTVSVAAIIAALPKLHTLKARGYCSDPAQAAFFFTNVLPRLRVFHFEGKWPDALPASTVAPLPLLD